MKKLLLITAALSLSHTALADRTALGDDGREIRLKDDGSWEYISTDRLATSDDGTRVRLKEDGSWEFIGNAPIQTAEQVRTENLDISLNRVITEFSRKKSGSRNEHYRTQTIFYLDLDVSSYGDSVTAKLDQYDLIEAIDDKGTKYPVIAVAPQQDAFEAGKSYSVAIRVDGSPSASIAWGTRKIQLTLDKSVFGHTADLTFTYRTDEIKKQQVDRLR